MKKALTQVNEQRLISVTDIQNYTPKSKYFQSDKNGKKILGELARKWVRFGCVSTPNEAIKILLEGCKNA